MRVPKPCLKKTGLARWRARASGCTADGHLSRLQTRVSVFPWNVEASAVVSRGCGLHEPSPAGPRVSAGHCLGSQVVRPSSPLRWAHGRAASLWPLRRRSVAGPGGARQDMGPSPLGWVSSCLISSAAVTDPADSPVTDGHVPQCRGLEVSWRGFFLQTLGEGARASSLGSLLRTLIRGEGDRDTHPHDSSPPGISRRPNLLTLSHSGKGSLNSGNTASSEQRVWVTFVER